MRIFARDISSGLRWRLILAVVLSAVACDSRGWGQAQDKQGAFYALVIGINNYVPPTPKLKTAAGDAEALAKVLSERYGFKVNLLLDGDATRDNILGAMDRYRMTLNEADSLLIYYAGHGFQDKVEDKAYWVPVDAERTSRSRWILADELTTRMRANPARHVLIVSDSCYSGGLMRDDQVQVRPADERNYLSQMLAGRSRSLMSSGGDEPVADEGGEGHSVFANAMLRALQGNLPNQFTGSELFYGSVLRQVAGKAEQVPKYFFSIRNSGDDAGDFVFQRSVGKGGIERGAAVGAGTNPTTGPAANGVVADAGVRSAQSSPNAVAEMSKRGRDLYNAEEYEEAVPLLKSAAEAGDADAQVYFGLVNENGILVTSDYGQALKWYRKSAEQGNANGERHLGDLYEHGWGTAHNDVEATKWYLKSALQGNARAQANVAKMYAKGYGVPKDEAEAVKWYRKSAEQGNADGQFNLGDMYENGAGVGKDLGVALYWYEKAAVQEGASVLAGQRRDRLKAAGVVAKRP